jgi:hypothetical protein
MHILFFTLFGEHLSRQWMDKNDTEYRLNLPRPAFYSAADVFMANLLIRLDCSVKFKVRSWAKQPSKKVTVRYIEALLWKEPMLFQNRGSKKRNVILCAFSHCWDEEARHMNSLKSSQESLAARFCSTRLDRMVVNRRSSFCFIERAYRAFPC